MTATTATPIAATDLTKGNDVRVTTTTGEVIEGTFVSLTDRGIRIHATPVGERTRYVTRKMSVVAKVELVTSWAAPAEEAEPVELSPVADEAPAAPVDAPLTVPAEWVSEVKAADATPAATPAPAVAAPAAQATAEDVDYGDPIINGKLLSTMKFAEVMELAKKYKTPGRGVARVDALRAGVAKAIALEVGRLAAE